MPTDILFDFGAVLIPIDPQLTYQAFEALGAQKGLEEQSSIFDQFERGELSAKEFCCAIQPFFFRKNIFKQDIADAWNALCYAEINDDTIFLLKRLKREYRLHLLSNTNELHIQKIKALCGPFKYKAFLKLFDSVHYSHEIGARKPEAAFFEKVLADTKLNAEDCFFIDDREENVEAARAAQIDAYHFNPEEDDIKDLPKLLKGLD